MIIYQSGTIDLRKAQAELIKIIIRSQQEIVRFKKGPHKLPLFRGRIAKSIFAWTIIKPAGQFPNLAACHKCMQVPVHGSRVTLQVLAPIDPAWLHSIPKFLRVLHNASVL